MRNQCDWRRAGRKGSRRSELRGVQEARACRVPQTMGEGLWDFIWRVKKCDSSFPIYYLIFMKMFPGSFVCNHKKKDIPQQLGAACH